MKGKRRCWKVQMKGHNGGLWQCVDVQSTDGWGECLDVQSTDGWGECLDVQSTDGLSWSVRAEPELVCISMAG
jgi:hypothetical protein